MLSKVKAGDQVHIYDDYLNVRISATALRVGCKYVHLSTGEQADKMTGEMRYGSKCYPSEEG